MSTTLSTPNRTIDISSTPGVPMSTLVRVEARKGFDTRAGRWFAGTVLALVLLDTVLGGLFFPEESQTYVELLSLSGGMLAYFLPVLMILLVTSEWSQRTGLATFTLEPRRSRVVTAKLLAGAGISLVVLLIAMVIAVGGTLLGALDGSEVVWSITGGELWSFAFTSLIGVFVGFALAMLVRNSAAAIVGYFVYTIILPTIVGVLGSLVGWIDSIGPWVEFNTAQTPLITGDYQASAEQWGQILVSGVLWVVLPVVLGVVRLVRAEVK
ncbi:hypothetical protein BH11ACT8_BH11ACT8_27550 [soil metagenome]